MCFQWVDRKTDEASGLCIACVTMTTSDCSPSLTSLNFKAMLLSNVPTGLCAPLHRQTGQARAVGVLAPQNMLAGSSTHSRKFHVQSDIYHKHRQLHHTITRMIPYNITSFWDKIPLKTSTGSLRKETKLRTHNACVRSQNRHHCAGVKVEWGGGPAGGDLPWWCACKWRLHSNFKSTSTRRSHNYMHGYASSIEAPTALEQVAVSVCQLHHHVFCD